jgi:pimeloyl-ACP methyl ester carboxylesterase
MLNYRIEGSGSPLLLIHGWGVTYATWDNLAPLLVPHFQLIMIELPGIGGSPQVEPGQLYYPACAEGIEEVRLALGIEKWSLLAYSSGTRAAEAYVQRYPQAVQAAIFLCPIYLVEIWTLFLHLLENTQNLTIRHWILSHWRLYSLILALGFNGRPHTYTRTWKHEIELQSLDILIRTLCEIPGKGRTPFELPEVPTLFIWGGRDALTARPRHLRPNDIIIPANHSAPMLAANSVAEVVIPFLNNGKLLPVHKQLQRRRLRQSKGKQMVRAIEQVQSGGRFVSQRRFVLRKKTAQNEHQLL